MCLTPSFCNVSVPGFTGWLWSLCPQTNKSAAWKAKKKINSLIGTLLHSNAILFITFIPLRPPSCVPVMASLKTKPFILTGPILNWLLKWLPLINARTAWETYSSFITWYVSSSNRLKANQMYDKLQHVCVWSESISVFYTIPDAESSNKVKFSIIRYLSSSEKVSVAVPRLVCIWDCVGLQVLDINNNMLPMLSQVHPAGAPSSLSALKPFEVHP